MEEIKKIGMGGGCHWCTEAVFQSLKGVTQVDQGYIASYGDASDFSEGVIIHFDPALIPLKTLVEIHLHTHKSTSMHSFREKYRSAIYFFDNDDEETLKNMLQNLQSNFPEELITEILPFAEFKASRQSLQEYYFSNPEKPFCQRYINPKIQFLLKKYAKNINPDKFGSRSH